MTSIVSSHDMTSCFRIAHQAILMMDGQIVAHGTPDELANSQDEQVHHFIASSGVDVGHVSRVPSGTFAVVRGAAGSRAVAGATR